MASNLEKKIAKPLSNKPIQFSGKIKYCTDFIECAIVCDKILGVIENSSDVTVLGFDMEWPCNFRKGFVGATSLIQISPNVEECYLLQVSNFNKIPRGLNLLLSHPNARITGVNIKADIKKLSRDFPGLDEDRILLNCIDLSELANLILPLKKRWSMDALAEYLLNRFLNKDNKIRLSQWNVSPLSKKQLLYAATDTYVSLLLYITLSEKQADAPVPTN